MFGPPMEPVDVQALRLQGSFKLSRVGISNIHKPVMVLRNGRKVQLTPELEVAVDLPADQRGSHLSRNAQAVGAMVDESVREPVEGLEGLCKRLAERLLTLHEYASQAQVKANADYFLEREFAGKTSLERYKLLALALAQRDRGTRCHIGVEVVGITACPCAMEGTRVLADIPDGEYISHNQRNLARLMVEQSVPPQVDADHLVDIVEGALSGPTFDILKRSAEAALVMQAHQRPRFVEDVVRHMLQGLLEHYPDLPDHIGVQASSVAQESIHKHDAFAERVATIGELKA